MSMHSSKTVVCVKVNGQILRETGDTVTIPFGSEFSVLIKNLDSVRAMANVSIDGKPATGNSRLIIEANSSVELERYIVDGNLQAGNRFKFIERTGAVESHRGIGSDDGLIRVEAFRERVQKFVDTPVPRYYDDPIPVPRPYDPWHAPRRRPIWGSPLRGQSVNSMRASGRQAKAAPSARRPGGVGGSSAGLRSFDSAVPVMDSVFEQSCSDVGITVPGSQSDQKFTWSSGFALEPGSTVIVLRLRGEVAGSRVEIPVTVKAKPTCSTCGRANKANSQFCSRCGTALEII
jgi:hypothetical protein